jgi:hypothetical protein
MDCSAFYQGGEREGYERWIKVQACFWVNVSLLTDEELAQCGIAGEGAGIVISLGKQEVNLPGLLTEGLS